MNVLDGNGLRQESTYGTHIHEKREDRESRFTGLINDIVSRGGRCLIPVFALGRAQELLLILGTISLIVICFYHCLILTYYVLCR